ncbi:hypothetical protein CDEST_07589 [Colletotrichum destructivum]|uniref:Uncharacterized protein n=1 Tax=Colletotrichum destructivum TaxID=34406 RepID=A0AAX4IHQ2_9PEZI|nr:hypothetical protein CDEST_07589 [Colletotrichum destructivum]
MVRPVYSYGLRGLCVMFILLLLYFIPIVTSPTLAIVLTKRVKLPVPEFPLDFEGRVKKGAWLNDLFSLSDREAKQWASPFQPADISTWGPSFGASLDAAFNDPAFPIDKSNNGIYRFLHNKSFRYKDGRKGKPTHAKYANVANPRAGAFVFDSNWSPKYKLAEGGKGDIPDLDTLSDIAYFQWQQSCNAVGVATSSLKVIFRSHVIYAPTFNTVVEAIRGAGYKEVPGWDERITFSMESREGLAILGSANGASTAWFLIQHRAELGAKKIKEVVVWDYYGGFRFDTKMDDTVLNLRFTVVDA